MSIKENLQAKLNPDNQVDDTQTKLTENGGSIQAILYKKACRREGIDFDDPPEINQFYLRGDGLIVLDLRGTFDDLLNDTPHR